MDTGMGAVQQILIAPLQSAWDSLLRFLPTVLGALVILLIGGLVAKLIEQVLVRGLKLVRFDQLADELQISAMMTKGGVRRKLSELIGAIAYWIVMLAFVVAALNALGLMEAADLFERIVVYLPNVVASVFILIVGAFAATFLSATVRTAASNSGIVQAHLLGQAVQVVVVAFAFVASLKQLQIQFVGEVFLIVLAGISLGAAIAFGLGCKDIAGRWVADLIQELQPRKR